jgi:sugar lactone lactonase YvrE
MKRTKLKSLIIFIFLLILNSVCSNSSNIITEWNISKSFNASQIDLEKSPYPRFYTIFAAGWQNIHAEASGLVDITKHIEEKQNEPEVILARTIFRSDEIKDFQLSFGFSQETSVFLNGKRVFYGNNPDQNMGFTNEMNLTTEKGLNEIFFIVKKTSGNWSFKAKTDMILLHPIKLHEKLTKVWETEKTFLTPESAVYDSKRDVLFVTNFDNRFVPNLTDDSQFTGYISKVNLNGEIEEQKWISNLYAPTGISIYEDKLYTLERKNLTEININTGKIIQRYPIPNCEFPNDLTIDDNGNVYITDTSPSNRPGSRIYKFKEGQFEVWEDGEEVDWSNGIFHHEGKLLLGNSGDGCLKEIDIQTKTIRRITCLGAGVIDGIRVDNQGNYLVSHWEGQIYKISPSGKIIEIADSIGKYNSADFEYIKEKNLLIVPTFVDNRVIAFKLEE